MAILSRGGAKSRDELMEAYLEAWNSHVPGRVVDFFALEGVYDDHGAGVVAQGHAAIREHIDSVMAAFPDLEFELVRAMHGDDCIGGEWSAAMTHGGELDGLRATGRRIQSAGVDLAMLDESGKVRHLVSYYDGAEIMRGLGLLPKRGSRVERGLLRAASVLPRRS